MKKLALILTIIFIGVLSSPFILNSEQSEVLDVYYDYNYCSQLVNGTYTYGIKIPPHSKNLTKIEVNVKKLFTTVGDLQMDLRLTTSPSTTLRTINISASNISSSQYTWLEWDFEDVNISDYGFDYFHLILMCNQTTYNRGYYWGGCGVQCGECPGGAHSVVRHHIPSDVWIIDYGCFQYKLYCDMEIAPPLDFEANAIDKSTINLTWTNDVSCDYTMIRWSSNSYPETIHNGLLLCNTTNDTWLHNSLDSGQTIYYSAFGYNSYSSEYSTDYSTATATTLTNDDPTISDLYLNSTFTPINNSIQASAVITDPDSDNVSLIVAWTGDEVQSIFYPSGTNITVNVTFTTPTSGYEIKQLRARGVDKFGVYSNWTDYHSVTVYGKPTTPENFNTSINSTTSINISFDKVDLGGPVSNATITYEINCSVNYGEDYINYTVGDLDDNWTVVETTHSYLLTHHNLTPGNVYICSVRAYNYLGSSDWSTRKSTILATTNTSQSGSKATILRFKSDYLRVGSNVTIDITFASNITYLNVLINNQNITNNFTKVGEKKFSGYWKPQDSGSPKIYIRSINSKGGSEKSDYIITVCSRNTKASEKDPEVIPYGTTFVIIYSKADFGFTCKNNSDGKYFLNFTKSIEDIKINLTHLDKIQKEFYLIDFWGLRAIRLSSFDREYYDIEVNGLIQNKQFIFDKTEYKKVCGYDNWFAKWIGIGKIWTKSNETTDYLTISGLNNQIKIYYKSKFWCFIE